MPATYEPIATTTLGSAALSITFSSIPATYTDLRVVLVGGSVDAGVNLQFQVNGDTATNYSVTYLWGNGSTANSSRLSNRSYGYGSFDSSTTIPALLTYDFFSYAGSTFKTVLATASLDKNGSGNTYRSVNLWRSTSAITSIALISGNGGSNWLTGTTATLYGIKNA